MESVMKVRRLILVEGRSIRSVSKSTGLSRNTLRKYLREDSPPSYQRTQPPTLHKLKDFEALLSQWYEHDLKRPKRERRTAQKLYEQLIPEGYKGSYSPVARFIKKLKSAASSPQKAYIPLQFDAGDAMQFDWSMEVVVLGGVEQKIKVAHFRLSHSRKPFIKACPCETQEMLLDAFNCALDFYQGVPQRVLIDNPKTMVVRIGKGKERDFHPRFLAMLNHYVIEPVACTPASGWEKGQVESQVHYLRNQLFKPQLHFDDLTSLNQHLTLCCDALGKKSHPQYKDLSVNEAFVQEQPSLRPLGRLFDGYVEKTVQVSSTCLVPYLSNHYSVPASYARQRVSLRTYAEQVVVVADDKVIATHQRSFNKHDYCFEPWHYVPLLKQKPGALRNGAPFTQWDLPKPLQTLKTAYLQRQGGDREFVDLLLLIPVHGIELVTLACEQALKEKLHHLAAIINVINRLKEPNIEDIPDHLCFPQLQVLPEANCARYEQLMRGTQ